MNLTLNDITNGKSKLRKSIKRMKMRSRWAMSKLTEWPIRLGMPNFYYELHEEHVSVDLWKDKAWCSDEKINGMPIEIIRTRRNISILGPGHIGNLNEKLSYLRNNLLKSLPEGAAVIGEMWYVDGFKALYASLAKNTPYIGCHFNYEKVRIALFDIIAYSNRHLFNAPYMERRHILESLPLTEKSLQLSIKCWKNTKQFFDRIVMNGGEGIILRRRNGMIGDTILKIKIFSSFEVKVTGIIKEKEGWLMVKVTSKDNFVLGIAIIPMDTHNTWLGLKNSARLINSTIEVKPAFRNKGLPLFKVCHIRNEKTPYLFRELPWEYKSNENIQAQEKKLHSFKTIRLAEEYITKSIQAKEPV